MTCSTCQYWSKDKSYGVGDPRHNVQGACQRFPPQLHMASHLGAQLGTLQACWPETFADQECGELKERKAVIEPEFEEMLLRNAMAELDADAKALRHGVKQRRKLAKANVWAWLTVAGMITTYLIASIKL